MPKPPNENLAALGALLASRPGAMPAWQVRALFLGALASTNMRLGPHHLLGRIVGDDDPKFESAEQVEALVGAMGELWNELAESSRKGVRLSEFQARGEPSIEHLRALAERRHEELRWFIRGIDAGGDDPAEFGEDGQELLQKLAEASAYFEAYVEPPPGIEKQPTERELRDSGRLLQDLTRTAERLIRDLLEVSRLVRMQALGAFTELSERGRTDDGLPAGARKVGRNEPCPCGSGKKWKKCCGAAPSTQH